MVEEYNCVQCKKKITRDEIHGTHFNRGKRVFLCGKCTDAVNHFLSLSQEQYTLNIVLSEMRVKEYFEGVDNGSGKDKDIQVQGVKSGNKKISYRYSKNKK